MFQTGPLKTKGYLFFKIKTLETSLLGNKVFSVLILIHSMSFSGRGFLNYFLCHLFFFFFSCFLFPKNKLILLKNTNQKDF